MPSLFVPLAFRAPGGGLHENVRSQCLAAQRNGWRVVLACPPGDFANEMRAQLIEVVDGSLDSSEIIERSIALGPFDLIHAHPFAARKLGLLLADKFSCPFIITIHGAYTDDIDQYHHRTSCIFAVSVGLRDWLIRETKVPPIKIVVAPNGLSNEILQSELPPEKKIVENSVLVACRLDKDKRNLVEWIVESWKLQAKEEHLAKWRIAGDGNIKSDLECAATELFKDKRDDRVKFLGWTPSSRMFDLFRRHSVVIASGRGALQATACGASVIGFGAVGYLGPVNSSSFTQAIYSGFGGLGSSPYELGRLWSDVKELLSERSSSPDLKPLVTAFFSQAQTDKIHQAVYEAILSGSSPRQLA